MRQWFVALIVVSLLLTGCSGKEDAGSQEADDERESSTSGSEEAGQAPARSIERWEWGEDTRRGIVNHTSPSGVWVGTCGQSGETATLDRLDEPTAHVLEGTEALLFDIGTDGTHTGFQVGWSVDDGAIEWLPVVDGPEASHDVAVSDSQVETPDDDDRWNFYYRLKSTIIPLDCSHGMWAGSQWSVEVVAVRTAS